MKFRIFYYTFLQLVPREIVRVLCGAALCGWV
jgi:hypothetical protein